MAKNKLEINRAPVLTLWAAVVAERLGHDPQEALTLGRGLAGLNAQSKGRRLGLHEQKNDEPASPQPAPAGGLKLQSVLLLGRQVPVLRTPSGLRAASDGKAIEPHTVAAYLEQKFGEHLDEARQSMESLAGSYSPAQLEAIAFSLYEKFRPQIPEGRKGWGAKGLLDLDLVRSLAK
jgi:hypothetical protein